MRLQIRSDDEREGSPWRARRAVLIALAAFILVPGTAGAQAPFTVGSVTAQPGTIASGSLTIAPLGGDEGTTIPFSIINGAKAGPVLALTAGTHGEEYPPILALQRQRAAIDPKELSGTIIMVHVVNMPSFLGRTIYYSPVDHKNQNRVFPGKADGTLAERIADAITREVIDRSQYLIDLHCGDGNESLRPYVYWNMRGTPAVVEGVHQLALAFGIDHIILDRGRPLDPAKSVSLSNTAVARGKPGLTIESGGMGQTDEASIVVIERGIAGVLKYLKMRATGPGPVEHPVYLSRNQVLMSGATGIFYPAVERGQTVAEGTLFGRITDFHGRVLEEIRAPFAGEVLYVVGTPPTTKGEPLGSVATPATEAEVRALKTTGSRP